jgi:hypothetical protein
MKAPNDTEASVFPNHPNASSLTGASVATTNGKLCDAGHVWRKVTGQEWLKCIECGAVRDIL